jgi:hypothetical protein
VCSLLSRVPYPKRVHFASLTLIQLSIGSPSGHNHLAPEQDHNHNLDSVALNYPCPVIRLWIVRHNGTKCRENETREWSYLYLCCSCRPHHTFESWFESEPPRGSRPTIDVSDIGGRRSWTPDSASQGAHHRCL